MNRTGALLRLLACALALGGCAESSVRYQPALPARTLAFPSTWEKIRIVGVSDPRGASAVSEANPGQAAPAAMMNAPRTAGPLIAVLEFRNRLPAAEKTSLDANYVSNAVRAAVKRTLPEARLMTEENIQVLLASAHKTLDDCQGECEVETGRLLGADIIITGDLLRVGTHLKLDMRMHETKSGQLVSGSDASGSSVDELDTDLSHAVGELMAGLR